MKRPHTVLFVNGGGELAGLERVFATLLAALDRAEVRPVVAALAEGPFINQLEAMDVEVKRLGRVPRLRQVTAIPTAVRALRDVVRETRAQIVQGNGEKMSVIAGLAARPLGVPVVAWLHDAVAPLTRPAAVATQLALRAVPTTSVVCCSEWLADAVRRRYRLRAIAIRNGLNLTSLPPPSSGRSRLLAATGWPDDAVVVAFVGRLQRWKGPDVFMQAAAEAMREAGTGKARFLVVGGALFGRESAFAAGLPDLGDRLGLGDRVAFLGHRPDALVLMSGADVVAHCSVEPDPLPTVIMEAMALGRAVVATRSRGPEELVTDGRDGILVPPGDAGALADALARLVGEPALRQQIGSEARQTAVARFDARRMADEFVGHWASLAQHGADFRPAQ